MGIVVQKYGGSSVADATGIKRVAQRIVDTRKAGNDVVVVVSAMGDTTDELRDLAEQVTPLPPPRELDMLLTAGERISMALLAMAIAQLGHKAQSFTGSQAGVITDSAHGKAKIIDITPGRIENAIRRRRDRDRGRLPGRLPGHQGHHHARPRRLRHHRGRAGGGARRRGVRDLQRRRRRLHRRPADRARPPASCDRVSTEEMLEMAASGAKILHLRCVEYARRYDMPVHVRSSFSQKEGTWIIPDTQREKSMEQAIIAGVAHDRSEAKITVVGVPDKVGEAARIFEALAAAEVNIDMVVQNVSAAATGLTDISFTLPREDGQTAMGALARIQDEVGYDKLLYDDQIGKVSLIGAGMRSHPGITAKFFAALASAGRQHRDDLHLRDPDLGDRRRGPGRRRRAGHPHRVRPRRRRGRGRRLRRDRAMSMARQASESSAPPARWASRCARSSRERDFPADEVRFFASARSAGTVLPFARPRDHRRGRRDRRPERARHRAVLGRGDHLAGAGAEVRRRPA